KARTMTDDNEAGSLSGKIVNFLFGRVLAGLVATCFTYKPWREQTRLDFAKERLADATKTFDNASQLMSERVFRSYDVEKHIGDDDTVAFAKRRDKLVSTIENWNLAYADMLQRFQFALEVDDDGKTRPIGTFTRRTSTNILAARRRWMTITAPAKPIGAARVGYSRRCIIVSFTPMSVVNPMSYARNSRPLHVTRKSKLDDEIDNLDALAGHVRV